MLCGCGLLPCVEGPASLHNWRVFLDSLFLVSQIVEGGGSCLVASFLGNAEQKIVLILLHGIISSSYIAFPFVFFQS